MAAMDIKPEFTVFKKESDAFTTITENRDLIRQKRYSPTSRQPN